MGLFSKKYKCPVTPEDRAWIEENLIWLTGQFGLRPLSRPPVDLSKKYFPSLYQSQQLDPFAICERIARHMDVDPEKVELGFYLDDPNTQLDAHVYVESDGKSSLGLYWGQDHQEGNYQIQLNQTILDDPEKVISTLAHELAHAKLLGESRISQEREDHEYLTDLTAIFWGFGIFTGNSRFAMKAWTSSDGWSGWSMSTSGYLPLEMIGFSLALQGFLAGHDLKPYEGEMEKGLRRIIRESSGFLRQNPELSQELASIKQRLNTGA